MKIPFWQRFVWSLILKVQQQSKNLASYSSNQVLKGAKRCGPGTAIWGEAKITGVGEAEFGSNVHIGAGAYIRAEGGLVIGDNSHISRNIVLYTINHNYTGGRLPYDETQVARPVVIGKNVWIGMNVCIAPGSVIGEGAIVGMGTVVSGEVPPLSIIGGSKWRMLGTRDRSHYDNLERVKSYGGPSGRKWVVE